MDDVEMYAFQLQLGDDMCCRLVARLTNSSQVPWEKWQLF